MSADVAAAPSAVGPRSAGTRPSLVERAAAVLDRGPSRRSFLVRAAVVGSALTVSPLRYLLRPGTAYAAVCGADSTCGSGYTAFCCTINNGVNRCPPGSLVGGWWKSDNSGFCCGNARYYIDCHSFCACGCEGGRNFCGAGCQNCSCGCGPSGQCDQRKVCCNNFRYGQCNQHISCTGPVWCRVVTCTPPWKVPAWRCSTTSATDQRTNDHGAPCLLDCTPIGQRYTALGGPGSFLGEATTGEKPTPDGRGRYQHFSGGSIYWHPAIGAFSVRGAIRDKWERLRWETGPLGYPVTDENPTPDGRGRFNHFVGGSIYWHPAVGAFSVQGAIRDKWRQLRWETGPLGYPVTDETPTPDGRGRFNHFVGGSIYWHPAVGAFSVQGAIRQRWELLGWETGRLGYPTTDETPTSDGVGRFNNYQGGSVYWHPDTGAHSLFEAVRTAWLERGGPSGVLGYPTGEPYRDVDRLLRSDFQGGFITYEPSTGATVVRAGGR